MKQALQNLGNTHAGVIKIKDGSNRNYGSIRVEGNNFIYYTGKGLREMFAPKLTNKEEAVRLKSLSEQTLIASEHIAVTPIFEIAEILH